MERSIVPAHRPDDSNKGHEDGNSSRKIGTVVDIAPYLGRRSKSGKTLIGAIGACRDHYYHNEQADYVDGRANAIEVCNPFGWHAGDAAVNQHDESCEEEGFVGLGCVGWVVDRCSGENHGRKSIVHRLNMLVSIVSSCLDEDLHNGDMM